jgi:hypothetical protein
MVCQFLNDMVCPPATSEAGAKRPRSILNLWTLVSNKKKKKNNNNKVKSKPLEIYELAGKKRKKRLAPAGFEPWLSGP